MSTRNQLLAGGESEPRTDDFGETVRTGPLRETAAESAIGSAGPDCARCGHALGFVDVEAVDRGRSTNSLRRDGRPPRVIEHVRCGACGAGGHRVRKTDTDAVVRSVGPAFPGFCGQIQNHIEMEGSLLADAPAPAAPSWEEIVVDTDGAVLEEASSR